MSIIDYLADRVSQLKPGQEISISLHELDLCATSYEHNGARFTPADQVLENVVGSSGEYGYRIDELSRSAFFYRNGPMNILGPTYVSPDRR